MDTVQIFFLESMQQDLEALLNTFNYYWVYGETRIHGPANEKILTAAINVGEITKIKRYGPKKRREGVKAERFALGRIGTYSKDLQIEDVPFVHIDNHPAFPEGIRFTYYKKDEVKERGGKTSDEEHGYARYEFEMRGDKIFAPVVHSFSTYANGPAMVSNIGNDMEIPLVLYLSEKERERGSAVRDKEALAVKLDAGIRTLIEVGTDSAFVILEGSAASPFYDALKLTDAMLKLAAAEENRTGIVLKRRALISKGMCYEAMKMHDEARRAYSASLDLPHLRKLSPVEQEDIAFAASAMERLGKK